MKRLVGCYILAALLAACGGIPLRSIPRLMQLQTALLEASPAELMLAIQVDARLVPPAGAVPVMHLMIQAREIGAFETIDKKLPMRYSVGSNRSLELAAPSVGRRWLIYSFPPESQAELARIQTYFRELQSRRDEIKGGSVSVGIAQEGVAAQNPALANTRWESWLQTSHKDGFFELWSGTVAALLKQANTVGGKS